MRVNFNVFFDNSTSLEALVFFAKGGSIRKAIDMTWDLEAIKRLKMLSRIPVDNARRRAKKWLDRNYDWE